MPRLSTTTVLALAAVLVTIALPAFASPGDRNPTFQHCLKGCQLTYCQPDQPPIPGYLRAFGWTCRENCAYECAHSFSDHVPPGGKHLQFYGKWAFYRLGPFQEVFSILMSFGNFYVNYKGLQEVRRRVRPENKLRPWLQALALVQMNTWIWSAVFHGRDTPTTERLDYFSATVTIASTLLYTLIRIYHLQTPLSTSRLLLPVSAVIAFLVVGHFTYLLSFPLGQFPYGYHTQFNLYFAAVHSVLWVLWSFSFKYRYPRVTFLGRTYSWPQPYPPHDPYTTKPRPKDAATPLLLVALTLGAMAFELLDFPPVFRLIDAHALWHAATIPLAVAWWHFLTDDAINLEGSLLGARGVSATGLAADDKPLTGGGGATASPSLEDGPRTPNFASFAAMPKGHFPKPNFNSPSSGNPVLRSPARSPGPKADKPE
ncbi:hypothetical protein IAU60_002567 [Kwoniella sp. DSM 27419]